MNKQLFLNLRIEKENELINLIQIDDDGMLHKIIITTSMIEPLINSLEKINDKNLKSNLPSQRESSAKEKGFPSFDEMQPLFINRK